MCVMSMVYDHFSQTIPKIEPYQTWEITYTPGQAASVADISKTIEEFRKATEAAAVVDKATGQADCVDLEKQKLEARVAELEKLLANPPEFVIVTGGNVEPGTYRVLDGKLYRLV